MSAEDPDALAREAREAIAAVESLQALNEARSRYLGKKGSLAQLLRGIGALEADERARMGQAANAAKREIEHAVAGPRQVGDDRCHDVELFGTRRVPLNRILHDVSD